MLNNSFIYQPPPGTTRKTSTDRILEVRLDMLLRHLSINPYTEERQVIVNSIIYDLDELADLVQRTTTVSSHDYEVLVQEMTQKIESDILPLYQAENFISNRLPDSLLKTWQVDFITAIGNSTEAVVRSLISEACAKAQEMPLTLRAFLAANTAELLIGSHALAEAAISRADDLLSRGTPDDPGYKEARIGILNVKSELLQAQNQDEQAAEMRKAILENFGSDEGNIHSRLAKLVVVSTDAVASLIQEDFAEAITAFNKNINSYKQLEAELEFGINDTNGIYSQVLYNHSGAMANLSFAYISISKYWDLLNMLTETESYETLPSKYLKQIQEIGGLDSFEKIQHETLSTLPILEQFFGYDLTPEQLVLHAIDLLNTAIKIAKETDGNDFVAIQTHRLALILDETGDVPSAITTMNDCTKYAAAAKDYIRLESAYGFLGQKAMVFKDGKEAMNHFKNASRFYMKGHISRGGNAGSDNFVKMMGAELFETIAYGGDVVDAILTVESLKSLSTSISLSRGIPLQTNEKSGLPDTMTSTLNSLLEQRETYRLQSIWNLQESVLLQEKIKGLENEIQQLRHQIGLRNPAYIRWADSTDIEIAEERIIARTLNDIAGNTTFAGFIQVGGYVWIYSCWKEGHLCVKRQIPSALLDLLAGGYDPLVFTDPSLLEIVSSFVLEPLADRLLSLKPNDRLILSPDEPLDMIPFGALPFRGKVLGERVLLTIIQGLGVLEACAKKPSTPIHSLLCVCAPKRPDDLVGLAGALAEASSIRQVFTDQEKQVKVLAGRDATISTIKKSSDQYDALHFACHATVDMTEHAWSQLLLTPEVQLKESGNFSEDRILSELTLKQGCLVNLAGCSTGVQGSEKKHLRSGLVPAFLALGASSVVASLWPINDDAASLFQAAFYNKIAGGASPANALAATQRECITGKLGMELNNIANWGSYLIYGVG